MPKDPWGTITCGQDLEPEGLELTPFLNAFLRLAIMDLF